MLNNFREGNVTLLLAATKMCSVAGTEGKIPSRGDGVVC
jgi:hypothetical protein